ncbi:hypothetical protein PXK56_17825 [Phaeobacter gallaeciensis]|uniref:hypothetical protein n=1 Tax=Phaeobacter gallaeciensis TaxID=60890 RepID=UPI0023805974|nr:hypothetical protein [Phaeobacter gallaeciensis]MDE4297048.1 hypothetical protein [Phaeobacter gallaeciensis]
MALSPALRGMVSSAKNKYKNSNGRTTKPKEGRNIYRILAPTTQQAPWVPATGQFWADLGVHWIKPDDNAKPIAVVGDCEVVYGKPSVINTAIGMAIDAAMDEDSKKLYESWQARKSIIVNAIDRSAGDTVVQLELTPTTFGKFLELLELYDDSGQDITDPTSGVDIVITKTGKGLNTEYDVAVAPGVSKPVTPDQLNGAEDLPKFIEANYFRGEEQKALNAIQQIAGIAVPALGNGGVATPTAALTSAAASVDPAPAATPTVDPEAEARKAAALAAQQAAAAQAQADAAAAAAQAQAQAAATDPTPVPAADPAPATGLDQSEEDALLAELDGLTNL